MKKLEKSKQSKYRDLCEKSKGENQNYNSDRSNLTR